MELWTLILSVVSFLAAVLAIIVSWIMRVGDRAREDGKWKEEKVIRERELAQLREQFEQEMAELRSQKAESASEARIANALSRYPEKQPTTLEKRFLEMKVAFTALTTSAEVKEAIRQLHGFKPSPYGQHLLGPFSTIIFGDDCDARELFKRIFQEAKDFNLHQVLCEMLPSTLPAIEQAQDSQIRFERELKETGRRRAEALNRNINGMW